MRIKSSVRRSATVLAAAGATLAISAAAASAHDCFIPMYSLNGPSSANWEPITAELAANNFAGFPTPCAGAAKAGYAALKAAGLPVGIKIYLGSNANEEFMTLGSHSANPNLANGKGLDNFEAGSPVPDQMLGTWIAAAAAYPC